MRIGIIVSLVMFLTTENARSQNYDTAKMEIGFKSAIYLSSIGSAKSSSDSFEIFLKATIRIKEVRAYGFPHHIAFFRIDSLDKQLGDARGLFVTNCPFPYIIAFNTDDNSVYRIRGFNNVDLGDLFGSRWPSKRQLKKYDIEDVDLECLIRGLRSTSRSYRQFPCLRGCGLGQLSVH